MQFNGEKNCLITENDNSKRQPEKRCNIFNRPELHFVAKISSNEKIATQSPQPSIYATSAKQLTFIILGADSAAKTTSNTSENILSFTKQRNKRQRKTKESAQTQTLVDDIQNTESSWIQFGIQL